MLAEQGPGSPRLLAGCVPTGCVCSPSAGVWAAIAAPPQLLLCWRWRLPRATLLLLLQRCLLLLCGACRSMPPPWPLCAAP